MWIGQDGGKQLRAARGSGLANPVHRVVPPVLLLATHHNTLLPVGQAFLELLVEHPLHRALDHTQVARAHALVQTLEPFVSENLLDAVHAVAVLPRRRASATRRHVLIQLQPCLDHPDRIRSRRCRNARGRSRREVHPRRLLAPVPVLRHESLAVAVHVEIDAAGRHNADQVGTETFEQGAPTLGAVYGAQNLQCVCEVVHGGSKRVHGL